MPRRACSFEIVEAWHGARGPVRSLPRQAAKELRSSGRNGRFFTPHVWVYVCGRNARQAQAQWPLGGSPRRCGLPALELARHRAPPWHHSQAEYTHATRRPMGSAMRVGNVVDATEDASRVCAAAPANANSLQPDTISHTHRQDGFSLAGWSLGGRGGFAPPSSPQHGCIRDAGGAGSGVLHAKRAQHEGCCKTRLSAVLERDSRKKILARNRFG